MLPQTKPVSLVHHPANIQPCDQDADRASCYPAAKAALKRKKTHELSLEQTQGQINTLEQQINAIESANINRETLKAMEEASKAMKQIHGKLTVEKVDETM
jgi:hypothetical protein